MIQIVCSHCNRMIDIDSGTLSIESTQVEPIKVPLYLPISLMMCRECQIDTKNRERDIKLNKVLRRGLKERIKQWLRL